MFQKLKQAISYIQKTQKTEQEIESICESLNFFEYFDLIRYNIDFQDKLRQCAYLLKHKQFRYGETIYLEGDKGSSMYFIFSGRVAVLQSKSWKEIQQEKELEDIIILSNLELEERSISDQELVKKKHIKARAEIALKYHQDQKKHLLKLGNKDIEKQLNADNILPIKQVCELKYTKTFGELFMITNQLRTDTIIASSDVHLAYLQEQDYKSLFKEQIEKGKFIVETLNSNFENIKRVYAAELNCYFESRDVFYKSVIYKEGEIADSIFLIKSGQIELKQFGSDKKEQSLSILTEGQFFGQEQGLDLEAKRICTAHCIANGTKEQIQKTTNWINKRKKQIIHNSTDDLLHLKEIRQRQKTDPKSQERKLSFDKNKFISQILTPNQKITRSESTQRPSKLLNKPQKAQNSKQWNNFFDAMQKMNEEKKYLKQQSQPQMRYQNIKKIVESNIQYKKLQKQLSLQAPAVDLEKNNLQQIVQNIKTKGLLIESIVSTEQSMHQSRRYKSLESILQTISNRENILAVNTSQNTKSIIEYNSSFSPKNQRFVSPNLKLKTSQQLLQNNQLITDNSNQQDLITDTLNLHNILQSQNDLGQNNQSLILNKTNSILFSQENLSQPIKLNSQSLNKNVQYTNNSPVPSNRRQRLVSAKRFVQNNSNLNKEIMRTETDLMKTDTQGSFTKQNNIQSNPFQSQDQIMYQNQFANKNYEKNPLRTIRMQYCNVNTSLSSSMGGCSSLLIPYPDDKDTIQESAKEQKLIQNEILLSTSGGSNTNGLTQQQKNQNKLNFHKSSLQISKPIQNTQFETDLNSQQKVNIQKNNNIYLSKDKLQEGQTKLNQIIKVNGNNNTLTPFKNKNNNYNTSSPVFLDISPQVQQKQMSEALETNQSQILQKSPSLQNIPRNSEVNITTREVEAIKGQTINHLISEESPPLYNRSIQKRYGYKTVRSFNSDHIVDKKLLINQEYSQNISANYNKQQVGQQRQSILSKTPNKLRQQADVKQDVIVQSNNISYKNSMHQNNDFTVSSETNLTLQNDQQQTQQQRKRSMNNFTEALFSTTSPLKRYSCQYTAQVINSIEQPNKIQDNLNNSCKNYHIQNSKYCGNAINLSQCSGHSLYQQSIQQTQQPNSTSTRFKYLDMKAETERIQQSLLLKKYKKKEGEILHKKKQSLIFIKNSSQPQPIIHQNPLINNSVYEEDQTISNQNVVNKLQKLFDTQKTNPVISPIKSSTIIHSNSNNLQNNIYEREFLTGKEEAWRYQNSLVREQTEADETTPIARRMIKQQNRSSSINDNFVNRQPQGKFQMHENENLIQQRSNTFTDITNLKQKSLTRVLNYTTKDYEAQLKNNNKQTFEMSCRNNHSNRVSIDIRNKSLSQNDINQNYILQNQDGISTLQNIPFDIEQSTLNILNQNKPTHIFNITLPHKVNQKVIQQQNNIKIQKEKNINSSSQHSFQDLLIPQKIIIQDKSNLINMKRKKSEQLLNGKLNS